MVIFVKEVSIVMWYRVSGGFYFSWGGVRKSFDEGMIFELRFEDWEEVSCVGLGKKSVC